MGAHEAILFPLNLGNELTQAMDPFLESLKQQSHERDSPFLMSQIRFRSAIFVLCLFAIFLFVLLKLWSRYLLKRTMQDRERTLSQKSSGFL